MFSPTKTLAQAKLLVGLDGQVGAINRKFRMAKSKTRQEVKVETRFKQPVLAPYEDNQANGASRI